MGRKVFLWEFFSKLKIYSFQFNDIAFEELKLFPFYLLQGNLIRMILNSPFILNLIFFINSQKLINSQKFK